MKKMIAFLLSFVLMFGSISAFAVSNEDTNDSRMSCVQEIDEDEIDEEVLREMMEDDDREGEELWKKISRRDAARKKRNKNKRK